MGCFQTLTGPLFTGFLLMLSLWGVIFLGVIGALYRNYSVGLIEDLPDEEKINGTVEWSERYNNIKKLYEDNSKNCWYACAAYAIILVYSVVRMIMITRSH